MTIIRRDGQESPFSEWLRSEPRLDSIKERLYIMDTDYWIHQYRAHTDRIGDRLIDSIMSVEIKTNQKNVPFNQRDTLRILQEVHNQTLRTKDGKTRTLKLKIGHEIRTVRFYGFFVLRMHGVRPDQSQWIEWHGGAKARQIDLNTLIDVLRFKVDPRTLKPRRNNERRSHLASARQSHPQLNLSIVQ